MVCKNRGISGFLGASWVLITMAPRKIGCFRFTELRWAGKHINIIIKQTNSPTQGQPNPRKIHVKCANGATFFPQQIIFEVLGLVLL